MSIDRREMLLSLTGMLGVSSASLLERPSVLPVERVPPRAQPLVRGTAVDWKAVRDLFPLARDWTHLAAFLFVSHPRPVAQSIDYFRRKIDSDHVWLEVAAFTDQEG